MKNLLFCALLFPFLLVSLFLVFSQAHAKPHPRMMNGRGQKSRAYYHRRYQRIQRQRQTYFSRHFAPPINPLIYH